MRHLPVKEHAHADATGLETTSRSLEIGEEFLDGSKAYLGCRSRGIEPPPPLVEAWKRFYEFYSPRIRAFLRNCGLRDADLNDCSQEVWQDVVSRLAQFQQDPTRGRLSTWIMTMAHNKAIDSIRCRNRHLSETLEDHEADMPLDPSLDPAAEFERRQTLALVQTILLELSGRVSQTSFQVLYQRWIEGRPTAEVAAALELTPDQVRFRSHRMKRKLRGLLERSMDRDATGNSPGRRECDG